MGNKAQSKQRVRVGLDIGSHSIKVVELMYGAEKPTITALGIKRVSGLSKQAIPAAIKELAAESKIAATDVVAAVSGPSVIVRFIVVPKMKEDELKSAIRFEAEKFVPFNISECVLDFKILRHLEKDNKLEVLLVAAKRDIVEERHALIQACGFSAALIDVDSFALANIFLKSYPSVPHDKAIALINVGSSLTNVAIVRDGTVGLVRDIALGGKDIDAALVKGLGLTADALEAAKAQPKELLQEAMRVSRSAWAGIFDEARLSCGYYENQSGRSVDEFYLTGGSARFGAFQDLFKDAVGVPPKMLDPFSSFDKAISIDEAYFTEGMKSQFAVAAGLALR